MLLPVLAGTKLNQVGGLHTQLLVAPMMDVVARSDRPDEEFIRHAMSAVVAKKMRRSVAASGDRPRPQPTSSRFSHVGQEAVSHRDAKSLTMGAVWEMLPPGG
jgi:hypothetical protein